MRFARSRSAARPAIGIAAAYGLALAALRGDDLVEAERVLAASRPTAVNLFWALDQMRADPTAGPGERAAPRGGRALPPHGRACGRALRARNARAHPLQRRRARDGRLRLGGRCAPRRLGARPARERARRRDEAAAPGRPPHGVGARDGRNPTRGDRGLGRRVDDGARGGRPRSSPAPIASRRTATRRTRSARTLSRCSQLTTSIPLYIVAPSSTVDLATATGAEIPIEERDGAEIIDALHGAQSGIRRYARRADRRDRHRERRASTAVRRLARAGSGARVKALVLAAGYATRLYPLTQTIAEAAAARRRNGR